MSNDNMPQSERKSKIFIHRINMYREHHGVVIYYQHFFLYCSKRGTERGKKEIKTQQYSESFRLFHIEASEAHIEYLFMHIQKAGMKKKNAWE